MSNRQIPSIKSRRVVDIPNPQVHERRAAPASVQPAETELRVGRNISLKGSIDDCAILTVEGTVEAAFSGRLINVAEHGRLAGHCKVDTAEIRGRFDGELTVNKLLRVHDRGQVSGTIRYARLEVVGGGVITGEIERIPDSTEAIVRRPPKAVGGH